MQQVVEKLNENANRLGDMGDILNDKISAMLVNVDTLSALYKDERETQQKMYYEAIDKLTKHFKHIIIALILTLALFIGGTIGTVAYILANFDIEFGYTQNVDIGGNGDHVINDGIHYDRTN